MHRLGIVLSIAIVLGAATPAKAQDDSLSSFVNDGGNFVAGGGYNFTKNFGVDTEFMWQDLPVNSQTKQLLQTPGASARQYA